MRWVLAIGCTLAAACDKGKANPKPIPADVAVAPVVTSKAVLGTFTKPPPPIVLIAAADDYRVATAASWDALARRQLARGPVKAHPTAAHLVLPMLWENHELGKPIDEGFFRSIREESYLELTNLHECDDPEPPAPEDDGSEESGGGSSLTNLEEGTMATRPLPQREEGEGNDGARDDEKARYVHVNPGMGKLGKDETVRVEGQYRMHREGEPPAPPLTDERRISGYPGQGPANGDCLSHLKPGMRRAQAVGDVDVDGTLDGNPPVVLLVAPKVSAGLVVDSVERSHGGAIGVTLDGEIRTLALRLDTVPDHPPVLPPKWIEVRVRTDGFEVGGPKAGTPKVVTDAKQIAAALAEARTASALDVRVPVDVLVADSVDAQRLVDTLAALIEAKVAVVGLGRVK